MSAHARLFIYPADVQKLTGKSARQCCRILQTVRETYKRSRRQGTLLADFCSYYKISEEEVSQKISTRVLVCLLPCAMATDWIMTETIFW